MSSTSRGAPRARLDTYPTPSWCVDVLFEDLHLPGGRWIEPAVGDGGLIEATQRHRADVQWLGVEVDAHRPLRPAAAHVAVVRADFLAWDPGPRRFDVALTNPPFSLARPFVEHARGMADHVVMLLRLNFLASAGRAPWMRQDAPDVYVLPNRPSFTGKGTDSIDYAWFHWGPQVRSQGALRVLRPLPASERRPKQ